MALIETQPRRRKPSSINIPIIAGIIGGILLIGALGFILFKPVKIESVETVQTYSFTDFTKSAE